MRKSVILAALLLGSVAQAQNFETVGVAFGGAMPLSVSYDAVWDAGAGAAVRAETPFYGGAIQIAFHVFPNHGRAEDLPDFLAVHGALGWGYTLRLPGGVHLTAGPEVGALHMRFDDDERFTLALQNETELTAGLFTHLDVPLVGAIRAYAGAEALRLFTAEPITLGFIHAGLRTDVATPGWLRRALR